jgi:uncharacterized protein YjeT (DUF2065 family)
VTEIFFAGLGLALFIEGLVFALAPSRIEDILILLAKMPLGTRRLLGLLAMAGGLVIVSLSLRS